MSKTAIIIPARYGSSRLEGKPLIVVCGKPIIQWVYEKAQQSKLADIIIVATDDQRIYDAVKSFGGNVEISANLSSFTFIATASMLSGLIKGSSPCKFTI